jgi:hypothetical protein
MITNVAMTQTASVEETNLTTNVATTETTSTPEVETSPVTDAPADEQPSQALVVAEANRGALIISTKKVSLRPGETLPELGNNNLPIQQRLSSMKNIMYKTAFEPEQVKWFQGLFEYNGRHLFVQRKVAVKYNLSIGGKPYCPSWFNRNDACRTESSIYMIPIHLVGIKLTAEELKRYNVADELLHVDTVINPVLNAKFTDVMNFYYAERGLEVPKPKAEAAATTAPEAKAEAAATIETTAQSETPAIEAAGPKPARPKAPKPAKAPKGKNAAPATMTATS